MRASLIALLLGTAGAALMPSHQARAWWDAWGRWHPDYVRPPVVVAPPPVYAPPSVVYPRPYARWIPPHWDRWGRWIPGHWA